MDKPQITHNPYPRCNRDVFCWVHSCAIGMYCGGCVVFILTESDLTVKLADKLDAERYRWLKEHGYANEKNASNAVIGDNKKARVAFRYWCSPSTLDQLIDAAIGG